MTKGPEAFRTISEAADELGVPQHVLRFWESKFSFVRPMKRAGGRRFYRPQDLAVLAGVRILLHDEGYTIKGVQKLHKEQGVRRLLAAGGSVGEEPMAVEVAAPADEPPVLVLHDKPQARSLSVQAKGRLEDALGALETAKARLQALLTE